MSKLIGVYERRSKLTKAAAWGALLVGLSFALDVGFHSIHWSWYLEKLVKDLVEGVLFGVLVWAFLNAREKAIQRRFHEIGYLNHHVRNALMVIVAYAETDIVKDSCQRIQTCIEKLSREEDCQVNAKNPRQP